MNRGQGGIALMEIVIVALVAGVTAGLALPAYLHTVEEGKRSEASYILHLIRGAQLKYQAETGVFTTNWSDLSIDDPNQTAQDFTFELADATVDDFLAVATRHGGLSPYQVWINARGLLDEVTTTNQPVFLPRSTGNEGARRVGTPSVSGMIPVSHDPITGLISTDAFLSSLMQQTLNKVHRKQVKFKLNNGKYAGNWDQLNILDPSTPIVSYVIIYADKSNYLALAQPVGDPQPAYQATPTGVSQVQQGPGNNGQGNAYGHANSNYSNSAAQRSFP